MKTLLLEAGRLYSRPGSCSPTGTMGPKCDSLCDLLLCRSPDPGRLDAFSESASSAHPLLWASGDGWPFGVSGWGFPYSLTVHGPDEFHNVEKFYLRQKVETPNLFFV